MTFDIKQLAKDIKYKRSNNNLSYRMASEQIGVSGAALCRIEKKQIPDIDTFVKIVSWLNSDSERYFKK